MTDTIVAVATPPGRGAIGVVRLSGPQAHAITQAIVGSLPDTRQVALRTFRDRAGEILDRGLVLRFDSPASYTGEDLDELQGHGGPVVLAALQEAACALGARLARPGEFTERAFINGRLDLAQAEAVADLIDAGSRQAARAALQSLDGELSRRTNALAETTLDLRTWVEGALDFSDEDIDWLSEDHWRNGIRQLQQSLRDTLAAADQGRQVRDGLRVAIIGRPNAGKSTLLNTLCGAETAIVTDRPGTTRDILRESIHLDGAALELLDTAGLREADDDIEREGVRRAFEALATVDVLVYVADDTTGLTDDDRSLLERLPDAERIIVYNKCDLSDRTPERWRDGHGKCLRLTARNGQGVDLLRDALKEAVAAHTPTGTFSARARHVDALRRATQHIDRAGAVLDGQLTAELAAEELRLAHIALGEITGQVSSDDLLGHIFKSFCIGK